MGMMYCGMRAAWKRRENLLSRAASYGSSRFRKSVNVTFRNGWCSESFEKLHFITGVSSGKSAEPGTLNFACHGPRVLFAVGVFDALLLDAVE